VLNQEEENRIKKLEDMIVFLEEQVALLEEALAPGEDDGEIDDEEKEVS